MKATTILMLSMAMVFSVGCTKEFTVSVSSNPSTGGTVNGGGLYVQGESCTVTAMANDGFVFYYWSEDNEWLSSDATYSFSVDRDRSIAAHFAMSSEDGHAYIDLGLPSGTLWAICNIGTNAPEGYGDYFAWGETSTKTTYNWSTYQHSNGGTSQLNPNFTKYCNKASYGYNGFTDNLTVLEASDDAAIVQWGSGWRTPTADQWEELLDNTITVWTTQNGVEGRRLTAINGNSLFLPAAGIFWDDELCLDGTLGHYWSSSLFLYNPYNALFFIFGSGNYENLTVIERRSGCTVRPVRSVHQN